MYSLNPFDLTNNFIMRHIGPLTCRKKCSIAKSVDRGQPAQFAQADLGRYILTFGLNQIFIEHLDLPISIATEGDISIVAQIRRFVSGRVYIKP